MSISLNRECGGELIEIPVASNEFFAIYWNRGIKECELRIFKENGRFGIEQLSDVLSELEKLKMWTERNVYDKKFRYMNERIDNLLKEIPIVFERDKSAILFLD